MRFTSRQFSLLFRKIKFRLAQLTRQRLIHLKHYFTLTFFCLTSSNMRLFDASVLTRPPSSDYMSMFFLSSAHTRLSANTQRTAARWFFHYFVNPGSFSRTNGNFFAVLFSWPRFRQFVRSGVFSRNFSLFSVSLFNKDRQKVYKFASPLEVIDFFEASQTLWPSDLGVSVKKVYYSQYTRLVYFPLVSWFRTFYCLFSYLIKRIY